MKWILAALLSLSSLLGFAQQGFVVINGLDSIQNDILVLKLNAAQKRLDRLKSLHAQNAYLSLLQGRLYFFRAFLPDDAEGYLAIKPELEKAITACEKFEETGHLALIAASELYLMQAFLSMRYGENMKAAWSGLQAYRKLNTAFERFPEKPLVRFGYGLLQATVGSLPENYRIFTKLIGMKGSVDHGIKQMQSALESQQLKNNALFYDEFAYMYVLVRFQLLEDDSQLLADFGVNSRESAFMMNLEVLLLNKRGENDKAITLMMNRPKSEAYSPFPYIDYLCGKALLNKQDPRSSVYFWQFAKSYKGRNHWVSLYRYLWWDAALKNQEEAANFYYQKAIKLKVVSSSDAMAKIDLESKMPWPLIKARLYFDGGYDSEALKYLNSSELIKQCKSLEHFQERHYRLGRILYRKKRLNDAEEAFIKALQYCKTHSFNCANSHLHLGFVYQEQGKNTAASEQFKKTLAQKGFPFSEGLHQKARTSLEELKLKSTVKISD